MWAIDSKRYSIPALVKTQDSDNVQWHLQVTEDDDDGYRPMEQVLRKDPFVYTVVNTETGERMSFVYNGTSVKPAYRTLRKYGAQALQPVVAFLANVVYENGKCWTSSVASSTLFSRLALQ